MIEGAMTAMITPFVAGQVDFNRLAANVDQQIDAGIDGLVPVGTTGESPTLSHDEHRLVIEKVVERVGGRVKVVAGTGSNSTIEAMQLTEHARSVCADGALLVNPYYNKPTQEGLYHHFMTIADGVDIAQVLYNHPGRTGVTLSPQIVARLAAHPNIVAIKEASGSLEIASEIASLCDASEMTIVSGDDTLTLPLMSIGGRGVISVLANLLPGRIKRLVAAASSGDYDNARTMHLQLYPLFKAMTLETNPIPIKTAMAICGKDSGEFRLPLCEMAASNRVALESALKENGVVQ